MNRTRLGGFFRRGIVQPSVTGWFVRSLWAEPACWHKAGMALAILPTNGIIPSRHFSTNSSKRTSLPWWSNWPSTTAWMQEVGRSRSQSRGQIPARPCPQRIRGLPQVRSSRTRIPEGTLRQMPLRAACGVFLQEAGLLSQLWCPQDGRDCCLASR